MTRLIQVLLGSVLAFGCSQSQGDSEASDTSGQPGTPSDTSNQGGAVTGSNNPLLTDEVAKLTPAQAETYLGKIAPPVVGRVLSVEERASVAANGGGAISGIVSSWLSEPGFVRSARRFIELGLQVSGQLNGVDFDLPGNLVEYVVTNKRPWTEILTSEQCYDAALAPVACDTGAPFTAGVLTTRAYLISRASRFNLTRSSALMKNFACQVYPQDVELQPRIEQTRLIPMFQAQTAAEQPDERAKSGFGNGEACYTCHGQFSLHSQLYVKFDSAGKYVAEATGLQDPTGELGRSTDGLMASHLHSPAEAASESSDMFGQQVANLKEAAAIVAQRETFNPCAAQRFLDFALGVQNGAIAYDKAIFEQVVAAAEAAQPEPTLQEIVLHLLNHPTVITSVIESLTGASE